MRAVIKDYNLTLDFGKGNEVFVEYKPIWDMFVGHPSDSNLWQRQKESIIACVESEIKAGRVPIVAIFTPILEAKARKTVYISRHGWLPNKIYNKRPCGKCAQPSEWRAGTKEKRGNIPGYHYLCLKCADDWSDYFGKHNGSLSIWKELFNAFLRKPGG